MITTWALYLLQVSAWWLVTWLITRHWLARYGRATQWRLLVLGGLIAGILVPLLPWGDTVPEAVSIRLPEIRIGEGNPTGIDALPAGLTIPWSALWLSMYLTGLTWRLYLWLTALMSLSRIYRSSLAYRIDNERIRVVSGLEVPFQFAGQIFMPEHLLSQHTALAMAIAHENAHKRLHHTWDLMIAQCISMVFWFHPLPPLLVKQLLLIHEFQADSAVLSSVDADPYVRFIGQYRFTLDSIRPAHALNHGPLKNRIMQIYRPSGKLSWNHRLLLLFALSVLITLSAAIHPDTSMKRQDRITNEPVRNNLPVPGQDLGSRQGYDQAMESPSRIRVVRRHSTTFPLPETEAALSSLPPHPGKEPDQMPRFPGCEEIADPTEREQCATRKFLQYVYNHLRYPEAAREQALAGTCIASFFVETDGRIREVNLLKDIGGGTDEAIRDIFRKMESEGIRWIPATQDGKPVRGEMTLPVRFALSEE